MSAPPDAAESSLALQRQEAEQERKPEPPQPHKWLALDSVIELPGSEDDERAQAIEDGTDVLLARNDPPLLSHLMLHPRVAPDPRRNNEPLSAYVLAADRSGFLLLQVVEGNLPDFFICNSHTSTVTILPPVSSDIQDSEGVNLSQHLSIGLIADPHHPGHFVVAQLLPTNSYQPNKLLCYSTAKGQWSVRHLTLQRPCAMCNPFSETGVLAHDGHLWWIALAYGVFSCDPFTPLGCPKLRFLQLPEDCNMDGCVGFEPHIKALLVQRRCVSLSKGKLRFVEIRGLSYDAVLDYTDALRAKPTVRMWTLDDPESPKPWKLEYEVAFAEIWDNKTYADEGLQPREVPHVALVDPINHFVIYFFQGSKLFGFDMSEKKVVACKECPIDRHQLAFKSSRPIVDAWEVPPPPPTLPGDDDSSPDDAVWSTQSYVEKKKLQVTESVDYWLNKARLEWTRDTDTSVENWTAWQMESPLSDESSVNSGGQSNETSVSSGGKYDESSVSSGSQSDDEPEIQSSTLFAGNIQRSQSDGVCFICRKRCDQEICIPCIMQVKHALLNISEADMRSGDLSGYCLHCQECTRKNQDHLHQDMIIPLHYFDGKPAAWVRGNEKWSSIFRGMQSDSCFNVIIGRPFLIHRPKAIRCECCNDVLAMGRMCGSLTRFCNLYCWLESSKGSPEAEVAELLIAAKFSDDLNSICLTCKNVFSSTSEGDLHMDHDRLAVHTDRTRQSWLKIPQDHDLAEVWRSIKGLEVTTWTGAILIKDNISDRCHNSNCRMRLVDGGGKTCSLECSAAADKLLPRPLLLR